jgi:hypothetical protein
MPNMNLTEIAIILDRSGSMSVIKDDMEGGFKTFIEEQKKIPDPCVVSLYQFDDKFETIFEEKQLHAVTGLALLPRGSTALLDACGRAITVIGERIAKKVEGDRPGKIIVVIITDGYENASREFKRDAIVKMITHQRDIYKWQFAFLGANMNAFEEAQRLGISGAAAMSYSSDTKGVGAMYGATGQAVSGYRTSKKKDAELCITPPKPNPKDTP